MAFEGLLSKRRVNVDVGVPVAPVTPRRRESPEQLCGSLLVLLGQQRHTPAADEVLETRISELAGQLAGLRGRRRRNLNRYLILRSSADRGATEPYGLAAQATRLIFDRATK